MFERRSRLWPSLSIVIAILVAIIALPQEKRTWVPSFLRAPKLHYGLDLIGGTQLDFRISEREMKEQYANLESDIETMEKEGAPPDKLNAARSQLIALQDQQQTIVEAIRTVLERRINALGVSEAIITPSYIGNEKHLLVECPGVVNTQECIDTVGKTIKLEFKEEFTEPTEEFEVSVKDRVSSALSRITESGETLSIVGQDLSDELGVGFEEERAYFYDELHTGLEVMWDRGPSSGVKKFEGSISIPEQVEGEIVFNDYPGIFLAEVTKDNEKIARVITDPAIALEHIADTNDGVIFGSIDDRLLEDETDPIEQTLKAMVVGRMQNVSIDENHMKIVYLRALDKGSEEMSASHILIAYKGALSAEEDVTRTRAEAQEFVKELQDRISKGEDFEDLAKEFSDGPSGIEGGSLGTFGRGAMVPTFEEAAFALTEGQISEPVETQFGFHLIRADSALASNADRASYDVLTIKGDNATELAVKFKSDMENRKVEREEEAAYIRTLFFSLLPTGWKDTSLDGKHFQSATVTLDSTTNLPVVQIMFDAQGGEIFHELTKNNVGKRIAIFVGGQLVSAPTVQTEIAGGIAIITGSRTFEEAKTLAQDLNTGAIPAPIYLAGQRTVEATLGAEALRTSVKAALIGIAILMMFMILMYRLLGLMANFALFVYALIFTAVLKLPLFLLSDQYIVLTLAGMAGIILSIGMAVDANILIFERIKEELRKGKLYKTAIETGFERAWPSIRDGNVSTFITCIVLFTIGTSIVRGFAATLGMGVLISMFSAIVVTRFLLRQLAKSPISENMEVFGIKRTDTELQD